MSYFFIIPDYLAWHYSIALRDIARVWTNLLWFIFNFFSIGLLARTFFSPWQRISETRTPGKFSIEDISAVIVTNTIMRLIGMVLKTFVLALGTLVVLAVFWGGIVFYAFWLALPVLAPASFMYGLSLAIF